MKLGLFFLILIISISFISADDCWNLENNKCNFVEWGDKCPGAYYSEFLDCEYDLEKNLNKEGIQIFIEDKFPEYNPGNFMKKLYNLDNNLLIIYLILILILVWIIKSNKIQYG